MATTDVDPGEIGAAESDCLEVIGKTCCGGVKLTNFVINEDHVIRDIDLKGGDLVGVGLDTTVVIRGIIGKNRGERRGAAAELR